MVGGFGKLRVMLISAQLGLESGTGAELGKMHLNHKTNGSLSRAELRWIRAKVNKKESE